MTTALDAPAFLFNPEQLAFEKSVAQLARKEFYDTYLPRASSEDMCWAELARLGSVGLLGMQLPEDVGGQNADPITIGIACEQLARADFTLSYLVFSTVLASALHDGLRREISEPVLRSITAGQSALALALTEPRGGSDTSGMTVTAQPVDDGYRISGEKTSVTMGMHAEYAIVVARVPSNDPDNGRQRTRRFLVRLDQSSISRQKFDDPGFKPLGRAGIAFDGTFVSADHEIQSHGHSGLAAQLSDFDLTRTLIGLMALGAAHRAIETTVEWTRQRDAFGSPIASYQGVSFTLAEHETQLEAARWLCYRSLGLRATGLPHTREAAMCKWWIPQLAVRAINDCIVIHGHVGWSNEMPLQQLLTDVSGLQIGDGTPQIQKLVIARNLIGRDYTG